MSRAKTLWLREPYLAQILAGAKTVEVRVGYDNIRRLEPGDRLKLNDRHLATIRRVAHYDSMDEMLAHEQAAAIAPDLDPRDLAAALRALYPPAREALGVVALEISPRRYDAVLFDMGYTLAYLEPPQELIVQKALAAVGAERSPAEIAAAVEEVWGSYYADADTALFPATEEYDRQSEMELSRGLLVALGVEVGDEGLQIYRQTLDSWFGRPGVLRPYPEVPEVLHRLAEEGYRLGIISNWNWNLRQRVEEAGLDGHFEVVWSSAYAGCSKPHPCIFEQVLTRMELAPERAIYVGDSYRHDVVGARRAGMDAVLVERGSPGSARDCPVIADLQGLWALLE